MVTVDLSVTPWADVLANKLCDLVLVLVLVPVRWSGGDVDGHGDPRVGGELHFDDVDAGDPDLGVTDGDLPCEGLFDVMAAPLLAEPLASFVQGLDQLGEAVAAGMLGGSNAELAEKVAGALFQGAARRAGHAGRRRTRPAGWLRGRTPRSACTEASGFNRG